MKRETAVRNSVSGADLHQYISHLIVIDGVPVQLLWADPEDNGALLRVRTAERGREYLPREGDYAVSDTPEPILNDDTTDRWDNEPLAQEADSDLTWYPGAGPGESSACALSSRHLGHYISPADLRITATRPKPEQRYPADRPGWLGPDQDWPCGRCKQEVSSTELHDCAEPESTNAAPSLSSEAGQ